MYQAGNSQADSTPPAQGLKAMWCYMLKQNGQCHVFMRQADVTMACIIRSSAWKMHQAILPLCPAPARPQQDTEPASSTWVWQKGQISRANPKGNKGCEGCEELQSTSDTTRERCVERSIGGTVLSPTSGGWNVFLKKKGTISSQCLCQIERKLKGCLTCPSGVIFKKFWIVSNQLGQSSVKKWH